MSKDQQGVLLVSAIQIQSNGLILLSNANNYLVVMFRPSYLHSNSNSYLSFLYQICNANSLFQMLDARPQISQIMVLPPFQHQGLGAKLIETVYLRHIMNLNSFTEFFGKGVSHKLTPATWTLMEQGLFFGLRPSSP